MNIDATQARNITSHSRPKPKMTHIENTIKLSANKGFSDCRVPNQPHEVVKILTDHGFKYCPGDRDDDFLATISW